MLSENTANSFSSFDWENFEASQPGFLGEAEFDATDSALIRTYLNWPAFFRKWELSAQFPDILHDPMQGPAAMKLFTDTSELLVDLIQEKWLLPKVIFGVWSAASKQQEVTVWKEDGRAFKFSFVCQESNNACATSYCLADFIKPKEYLKEGESDFIGGYVIHLGDRMRVKKEIVKSVGDKYSGYLLDDLCAMYLDAIADYLHYRLRRFIWAYCDDDDLSNEEIMLGLHQGIRVEIGGNECPDLAQLPQLIELLGVTERGFGLTEAICQDTSLTKCGLFFAHPLSRNFTTKNISDD